MELTVHGERRRRIPKRRCNGVARIFVWVGGGGTRPMSPGTFYVISTSRPHSVGGGGSSRNYFRDLHKRTTFATFKIQIT